MIATVVTTIYWDEIISWVGIYIECFSDEDERVSGIDGFHKYVRKKVVIVERGMIEHELIEWFGSLGFR